MPKSTFQTSRRDFLRASALTTALFGGGQALATDATRASAASKGAARNVIFMVSDGMNHGALSLSRQYQALTGKPEPHWIRLYRERPAVRCLAETFSANSCVTDSAAAASAWGSGHRVHNGRLNVLDDGAHKETLHEKLRASGRRTGLVTTATVTHATPAGFAANVDNRGEEEDIAVQYLDRKVHVLLGGGQKFFSADLRKKFAAAGYDVFTERRKLLSAGHDAFKPALGVFSESHLPFTIDRDNVDSIAEKVPTLSEMTRAALGRLNAGGDGFFLMVEGARIDHAGHANDAAASIHDQAAFDDAIGVALEFVDAHPDTLLIITTDHGCGGIQMNGVSVDPKQGFGPGLYNASNAHFERVQGFTRSLEWMKQNGIDGLSGDKLGTALKQFSRLELTKDQLKTIQGLKPAAFGSVFAQHTGIAWTSTNHTGELVEFCAYGAGAGEFPAFLRNDEVHNLLLRAMEISA